MIQLDLPLILASGSPRRKEILDSMGLSYMVDVSDVDESYSDTPRKMVMELSRRKALAVSKRHPEAIVLAADTLVFTDEVLGKPRAAEHARCMLEKRPGNWHSVFMGITLINTRNGKILQDTDETKVHFCSLSQQDVEDYVATGEPLDKAGAYGIQGMGGMLIDRIEGSYSNVVGLPMAMLRNMLRQIS